MATTTQRNAPKSGQTNGGKAGEPKLDTHMALFLAGREAKRGIKLHNQQNQEKGGGRKDASVLKVDGTPDLRFADNASRFKSDSSQTKDGNPDRRFVDNRPDIIAQHKKRGNTNVIFGEDFVPPEVMQLAQNAMEHAEAAGSPA